MCSLGCTAVIAIASSQASAAGDDHLIARETFFGNPDHLAVEISPDGNTLSYIAPYLGVLNVWVRPMNQTEPKAITTAKERPIRQYFWAQNSHQIIYTQDRKGDENFHLYAVDIESGKQTDLTPYDAIQARLIASDPDIPDEILVAINNRNPQLHDAWRINTTTGVGSMIFQNDAGFADLAADSKFQIRLATRSNPSGGMDAFMRDDGQADWYELASWGLEDGAASAPLGFSHDGRSVYLTDSRGGNTARLCAFTINDQGETNYTPIAADERSDVGAVLFHPTTGEPQAVSFEYLRKEWRIVDPAIRPDFAYLQGVAEGDINVVSRDRADDKWIVSYTRDDGPVGFFVYSRPSKHAEFLFTNRSQLEGLKLAHMKPVEIKARDGLTLVSYLTLPVGGPKKNLPLVLLVHGGPWSRDSWSYNSLHQWLANRGYAVLSVNYRGSTGLGKNFMNAGNREWAGKMHDDLIDAVNWAVTERIADPKRVAIMGGSYGGYATLVGLTFTPDFFTCGIDIVGPSHIRTLLETIPPYWEPIRVMFEKRVGSMDNPGYLDQISPLSRVDAIRRPLLIGQGQNDPRVKEAESMQIVSAMQSKNLPVTYIVFPDEGHGFARPENNLAFFAVTEAFLAQHMGGKFEPIGSTVRASSAEVRAGAELIPGLADSAMDGK
jgi:dipeptidyl aminopeptidase/acylaminoacyl peptidase